MQSDVQLALEVGHFANLQTNGGLRRKDHRRGKVTKGPISIRESQAGDIEDRLVLKLASRCFVEESVKELNVFRRRANDLKKFCQERRVERSTAALLKGELGNVGVELEAVLESRLGTGLSFQQPGAFRQTLGERIDDRPQGNIPQTRFAVAVQQENRRGGFRAERERGHFRYDAVADGNGDECRLDADRNRSVQNVAAATAQLVPESIFKRDGPVLR